MHSVHLSNQTLPAIGQGTWRMGERPSERKTEANALRQGVDLGMTLIDTAEMYGEGGAEEVVGDALQGIRDQVYLVSKVYPHNASRRGTIEACERSLKRLRTDSIDLYLLHWRGQYPLEETVEAFERLREQGKIARWGVSNFDLDDMHELNNPACATNQVLYSLEQRGVGFDLLPWCQQQGMPLMAYCPVGQGGRLLVDASLRQIAERRDATPAQVALAWLVQQGGVIAIPKAVTPAHVQANAAALALTLDASDLRLLDDVFPPPTRKRPLAMV
ncbi:diketogulonate reductase-like aldo/keto reductase [Pseudomonas sp. TE3786]